MEQLNNQPKLTIEEAAVGFLQNCNGEEITILSWLNSIDNNFDFLLSLSYDDKRGMKVRDRINNLIQQHYSFKKFGDKFKLDSLNSTQLTKRAKYCVAFINRLNSEQQDSLFKALKTVDDNNELLTGFDKGIFGILKDKKEERKKKEEKIIEKFKTCQTMDKLSDEYFTTLEKLKKDENIVSFSEEFDEKVKNILKDIINEKIIKAMSTVFNSSDNVTGEAEFQLFELQYNCNDNQLYQQFLTREKESGKNDLEDMFKGFHNLLGDIKSENEKAREQQDSRFEELLNREHNDNLIEESIKIEESFRNDNNNSIVSDNYYGNNNSISKEDKQLNSEVINIQNESQQDIIEEEANVINSNNDIISINNDYNYNIIENSNDFVGIENNVIDNNFNNPLPLLNEIEQDIINDSIDLLSKKLVDKETIFENICESNLLSDKAFEYLLHRVENMDMHINDFNNFNNRLLEQEQYYNYDNMINYDQNLIESSMENINNIDYNNYDIENGNYNLQNYNNYNNNIQDSYIDENVLGELMDMGYYDDKADELAKLLEELDKQQDNKKNRNILI